MTAVAREQSYGPIQAYAKLQGENFVYYVQTLELTLGRRVDGYTDVQVDLGPSRTISRQHAKIVYDFTSRRFMLHPLGKNGVAVNGHHYKPGAVIPLETKTAIQIGEVCFYFLLPIGNVSQSVKPVAKAPALQLGQLYSRSPSPTDTLTRPNSSIPTRVHSSYNSRSASPIQGGADDFAAQLTERLAPLASSGGDPPAKMPKAEPMAAPQHTPNTGRALARSRPNSKRTSKTASTSVASSFIPAPPPADLAALPDDEPWRDDPTQKPPYSYATLIAQAIWSQPDGKMTLAGIYNYIMTTYKYYDMEDPSGWQNSIRHNLSLNKAFIRVARGPNEPGKGAFWSIDPKCADNLKAGLYRRRSRGPKNATGKVSRARSSRATSRRSARRSRDAPPQQQAANPSDPGGQQLALGQQAAAQTASSSSSELPNTALADVMRSAMATSADLTQLNPPITAPHLASFADGQLPSLDHLAQIGALNDLLPTQST